MPDFTKLVQHPDLEEIIQKLTSGISPKNISDWLKQKYPGPGTAHLYVTPKLLQDFLKSSYMDFKDQVRKETEKIKNNEKPDNKLSKSLRQNDTWQELLDKQAKLDIKEIDLKQLMVESLIAMRKRAEQVFDVIQQNPESVGNREFALNKWFDTLFSSIKKYDEIINKKPEQSAQTNIYNIQIIQQHIGIFQDAIRNTISKFDPEIASQFVTYLEAELTKLNPAPQPKALALENQIDQLEALNSSLQEFKENTPIS